MSRLKSLVLKLDNNYIDNLLFIKHSLEGNSILNTLDIDLSYNKIGLNCDNLKFLG